jgi:hypothetical protein
MEFIDFALSSATPIIVLILGIWAKNIAIDYERRAALNGRIIEKRVEIYEKIGEDLNDIFVFLLQVGDWKQFSPDQIIDKKRRLDKLMYINRPYWSDDVFLSYNEFMDSAFETYTEVGEDAKIKTVTIKFEKLPNWNEKWKKQFSKSPTKNSILATNYTTLMKHFSREFGYYQKPSKND